MKNIIAGEWAWHRATVYMDGRPNNGKGNEYEISVA